MKATSIKEAWQIANTIFPTDYNHDSYSSKRAGYPVYRGSLNPLDYICDLGNRLEINLSSGKTVNVCIEEVNENTDTKTLISIITKQEKEIEYLKKQLSKILYLV